MMKSIVFAALLAAMPVAAFAETPAPSVHHAHHQPAHRDNGTAETRALNLLAADGYVEITEIKRAGSVFEATAQKNGKSLTVTVDPKTGQIKA